MLPDTGAKQQKSIDETYSANDICMTIEFPQKGNENI